MMKNLLQTQKDLIAAWQHFLSKTDDWQKLTDGITPKKTGCGLVYELPNFLNRPNENFAIADMRQLSFTQPHYHHDQTEVYFVIQGKGLVVVGGEEKMSHKEDAILIPPHTAHFTIPDNEFVIGVVNTPPWKKENEIPLTQTNTSVGFDYEQFQKLSNRSNKK